MLSVCCIHEISFPSISTGVYGYPKDEAAKISVSTVKAWLNDYEYYNILIRFVCYTKEDAEYYKMIMQEK